MRQPSKRPCSVAGCRKPHVARGFCNEHWKRWRLYGDPEGRPQRPTPAAYFWRHVAKSAGCWDWTGARSPEGYGKWETRGRYVAPHRWAWEQEHGPIPEGLTIDHLCNNPSCVRPSHLTVASYRDNILRGDTTAARNAAKTHCPQGHPYDEANTYHDKRGRKCRACGREATRRYLARKRVQAA